MTNLPKLYPGHRHTWVLVGNTSQVCCTVCGFTVPRSAAKLDGQMTVPVTDNGVAT